MKRNGKKELLVAGWMLLKKSSLPSEWAVGQTEVGRGHYIPPPSDWQKERGRAWEGSPGGSQSWFKWRQPSCSVWAVQLQPNPSLPLALQEFPSSSHYSLYSEETAGNAPHHCRATADSMETRSCDCVDTVCVHLFFLQDAFCCLTKGASECLCYVSSACKNILSCSLLWNRSPPKTSHKVWMYQGWDWGHVFASSFFPPSFYFEWKPLSTANILADIMQTWQDTGSSHAVGSSIFLSVLSFCFCFFDLTGHQTFQQ